MALISHLAKQRKEAKGAPPVRTELLALDDDGGKGGCRSHDPYIDLLRLSKPCLHKLTFLHDDASFQFSNGVPHNS